MPQKLDEDALERDLISPHEHLLTLAGRDGAVVFTMILFGELGYKLAISSALEPRDGNRCWMRDGRGGPWASDLPTTTRVLIERLALFGGAERLRSWRPPSRFLGIERRDGVLED